MRAAIVPMRLLSTAAKPAARSALYTRQVRCLSAASGGDITKDEVLALQDKWANGIKSITKSYMDKGDFVGVAAEVAGELYGYGHSNVLFKPTKAAEVQFRPEAEGAMSYFVGAANFKN